jgi:septal ring factor EnvC (AmiA/AmiB activator)
MFQGRISTLSPPVPAKAGIRRWRKVLFRLAAAALIGLPVVAWAQSPPSLRDTYSQDDLRRVEQARDEALKRLRALETASKSAEREASEIDQDLLAAAGDSLRREEAATTAEIRLAELAIRTQAARARLTADETALEDVLAALMAFGARRPPALAASPEATGDAVRAAILMGEAAPVLSARARELKALIEELNTLAAETYSQRERLDHEEAALAARREEIAALAAEKRLATASLAAETRSLRAETTRLSAEASTLRDLLDGLARTAPATPGRKPVRPPPANPPASTTVSRSSAAPLPGTPAAGPRPAASASAGPLQPAAGTRLRGFGQTIDGARHEGLTLATRSGAQVVAPLDARVQFAGVFRSYGQMIILDVGGNVLVVVSGLDALYTEAGQWVLAGEPIGRMTDRKSPSPELYLEVRKSGKPVDPEKWLASKA